MPKLLFTPMFHRVGDEEDVYVTSCQENDPIVCIRCNNMAKFILEQMHPDHKPRIEIITEVMSEFSVSETEATEAVNEVISKLYGEEEQI